MRGGDGQGLQPLAQIAACGFASVEANDFVHRAEALLDRVDALLPPPPAAIDWQTTLAARWQARLNASSWS